ncbi:MAG: hypothetical protein H7256_09175 [Bdellovibrio sp.]|nr:hypothetical protein [Bdellovibrio sp.]
MPHNILDATRSYVWNKYVNNPAYSDRPGYILQILAIAAAKETEYQLQNQKKRSPYEMNLHFMNRIDQQFRDGIVTH